MRTNIDGQADTDGLDELVVEADGVDELLMEKINGFISNDTSAGTDGEDKGRTEPVVTNGDLAGTDGDGEGRTEVSATNEEVANTDGKDEGRTEAGETNEEPANTDGGWMNFARTENVENNQDDQDGDSYFEESEGEPNLAEKK